MKSWNGVWAGTNIAYHLPQSPHALVFMEENNTAEWKSKTPLLGLFVFVQVLLYRLMKLVVPIVTKGWK